MIEHPLAPFRRRDERGHGLSYFEVPKDTVLYRGDLNKDARLDAEPVLGFQGSVATFDWFGFSPADVAQYGPVHEYVVTRPFRILEINDDTTMTYLYDLAEREGKRQVKSALKRQFGYDTRTKSVGIRESNEAGDLVVVNFLMNVVFPQDNVGYGIDAMPTSHGGRFHPEICIRDPTSYTRWLGALEGQSIPVASPPRMQVKRRPRSSRKTPSGSASKTPSTASATRRRMQWSRSSSKPTAYLRFHSSSKKDYSPDVGKENEEENEYDPFAALVTERTSPLRKKGRS